MAERDGTTAEVSRPPQLATASSNYARDKKWDIGFIVLGMLTGALHAYTSSGNQPGSLWAAQAVTEAIIFGGLGWLVRQADYLRQAFFQFQDDNRQFQDENKKDRSRIIRTEENTKNQLKNTEDQLKRLCDRAEKSMDIKEGIYGKIGNVFSHQNPMARRFLMGSVFDTLQPLHITNDSLAASSDIFTRSLYAYFWDELLDEQLKLGRENPLRVYLSHSSSIEVFEQEGDETDLLARQGEFAGAGGEIRRILVRHPNSVSEERYEAVKNRMEELGASVKILNLEREAGGEYRGDFLLVEINKKPYVLEWEWKSNHRDFGHVFRTNIFLTESECERFFKIWRRLVRALRFKNREEDFSAWEL